MLAKTWPLIARRLGSVLRENRTRKYYQLSGQVLNIKNRLIVAHAGNVNSVILDLRHYSKGKDIKRDKKKKIQINEHELGEVFDVEKLYADISKPLDYFKQELVEHTSLRTSQGAIENIKVEFEGETYIIQDLAEFGKKNPKLYVLDFSAFPQTISAVVKVLQTSELNLNVQQEGTKIYIPVPKVTKEHREALSKKAKIYFLRCKEKVKNVERKYLIKLKNMESISDDVRYSLTDQINALGEKQIQVAQEILTMKNDELLKNYE